MEWAMNESVILSTLSESITFLDENEDLNCDSLPSQLFGRDRESNTLKQTFEKLRNSGGKNFAKVLVHGESGSGKTSLVESLRQSVLDSQGFFVSGKYFQTLGNQEPYSAIMAAFSDLCDLIIQSERYNEEQRLTIQKKLRPDHAYLLQKTISNISPFLDTTLERSATHGVDVQNSAMFSTFKDACKSFLQAMSCADHPIVLFIDDIQWMDESSKKLITYLWNDRDISGIMLILAYRDEDSSNLSHILSQLDSDDKILNIGIKNLDVNDINILVKSLIGSSSKPANQALSKVFKSKTGGNPFHLIQIIQFAKEEGLLSYNAETKFWDFDVDAIQTQIMVSETLADLLTKKILILPQEVQESLKIASLLGFRFREDMVAQVKSWIDDQLSGEQETKTKFGTSTVSSSWVSITLSEALKGGFVEKCTYGYLFSHDKLQSAFQSLLSKDEASRMHETIGEIYLAKGDPESIYHAVNHLQLCEEYATSINKHVEFAQMHLLAANYCRERSAFIQARDLLRWGLTLLGDEKWENDFSLAFQFTESLAKMELIIGNFESCSMLTKICLDRATSRDMKIDSLVTSVESCMTKNDLNASSLAANHALRELGVNMPIKTSFFHVATKFMKVKWLIGHKSDEEILNLPQMTDKLLSTIVRLLVCLCMYCFLRDEETQGAYAALLATEITLKNGLSAYSSAAFAIYGVAELSNGHYFRAYRFGKLALDILKQSESRAAESYTKGLVMASLTHWFDPLNGMPMALRQAARHGFFIGDVVNGSFCLGMSYAAELFLGTNLQCLECMMRENDAKIREKSESLLLMWTQPCIQFVLNLRKMESENWADLILLSGEFMNEQSFTRQVIEAKHLTLWSMLLTYKCILAACFGFWSDALSNFYEAINVNDSVHYSFGALTLYFYGAIASYSLYANTRKKRHLRAGRKWKAAIAKAQHRGNKNALVYLTLLDAEDLCTKKSANWERVLEYYDKAIETADYLGIMHQKAFNYERAAFFLAHAGKFENAKHYFGRSMHAYKAEWGSHAKCEWLEKKSDELLKQHTSVRGSIVGSVIAVNVQ